VSNEELAADGAPMNSAYIIIEHTTSEDWVAEKLQPLEFQLQYIAYRNALRSAVHFTKQQAGVSAKDLVESTDLSTINKVVAFAGFSVVSAWEDQWYQNLMKKLSATHEGSLRYPAVKAMYEAKRLLWCRTPTPRYLLSGTTLSPTADSTAWVE